VTAEAAAGPVEHFFRHEYGRLVAQLTHKVGARNVERVEDAVQGALAAALEAWVAGGLPRDPSAWLYRVACNRLLGTLRQESNRQRLLATEGTGEGAFVATEPQFAGEVQDDLLRMLFVCCDDAIVPESRLVLALKTLCGFDTSEIALRLFTSEANVHKRLQRARNTLRAVAPEPIAPPLEALASRIPSVHEVLYLLFTEGYLSVHAESAIRHELCDEAIRLGTLLGAHPVGAIPETYALLALMHLHRARLGSRTSASGGLLLLEEQDRARWDRDDLAAGAAWLERSAVGDRFSRFHAEAGIAAEHCFSPSFHETRWHEIAALYAVLERVAPSPLHALNRALAIAEWQGVQPALDYLDGTELPSWLTSSYLYDAAYADLHRRAGNAEICARHRERALSGAPTAAVRDLLRRRLAT